MPSASVPNRTLAIANAHLMSAEPIAATDWVAAARAFNELDGMGSALIPMCSAPVTIAGTAPADLDGLDLTFTVWPRYQCTHRLWLFSFPAAYAGVQYGFGDPSGGTQFGTIPGDAQLLAHVETVVARTSTESIITVEFAVGSDAAFDSIGCYELPRASLAIAGSSLATADAGMNDGVVQSGWPILDGYAGDGVGFVPHHLDDLRDAARRTGLFAAAPFASKTSGSFVTILQAAPVIAGRSLYNGQTQSIMQLALSASVSASGVAGECRVTMASGATVTLPITGSGTVRGQIAIDCEDLTASDGRRASRDETVTVELRRTSSSGTVTLNTINGGEARPSPGAPPGGASGYPYLPKPTFSRGPFPKFMGPQ